MSSIADEMANASSGHQCNVGVMVATGGILAVICTAAGASIYFQRPFLFVFILLGTASFFVVTRALISFVSWYCYNARNVPVRRAQRQQRLPPQVGPQDLADIVLLMESGDLTHADIAALMRVERGIPRRGQTSLDRQIARLPTHLFHPPAPAPAPAEMSDKDIVDDSFPSQSPVTVSVAGEAHIKTAEKSVGSGAVSHSAPPDCVICLEKYQFGESIQLLPCMHGFHEACLAPWLHVNASCPVCKTTLRQLLRAFPTGSAASERA
jgi:hypothetical protein